MDDHQLMRDGLISLLADSRSIEVVGDVLMHGMTGLEATRMDPKRPTASVR